MSSSTSTGTYAAISGATAKTYVLNSADQGRFIKFEVTPVSATGNPSVGAAVQSASTDAIHTSLISPQINYNSPLVYTKGVPVTPLVPVNNGGPVVSYSVAPALPVGLILNPSTGIISGTPASITAQTTYTITATNAAGSSSYALLLQINDVAPVLSYANPNVFTKETAIVQLKPVNTGGAVISYSVASALPSGLILNTVTGVISGTPSTAVPESVYLITATNSGGSFVFNLSIGVDEPLPVVQYTTPITFVKGVYTSYTPTNNGGSINYTVNNPLPEGISLNASTGTISGTPVNIASDVVYVITATNSKGNTSTSINLKVNDANPKLEVLLFASNPAKQSDGSFNIDYRVKVSNIGNTNLFNLGLIVDLSKVFPSPVQFKLVDTPVGSGNGVRLNVNFNGVSNTNLLALNRTQSSEDLYFAGDISTEDVLKSLLNNKGRLMFGSSQLAVSDTASVIFRVNITPNGSMGPFSMEVVGSAEDLSGRLISETSTDGRLVANTGITTVKYPTIVSLIPNPQIGSSLNVQEVARIDDNSYNVKFRAKLKNAGNLNLSKVKLLAALRTQFYTPATFSINEVSLVQNEGFAKDNSFNGSANTNLLLTESAFAVGKENIIDFTINVNPNGAYGSYYLQLQAEAYSFDANETITIKSANGLDPVASLFSPSANQATEFVLAAPGPKNLSIDKLTIDENNSVNDLIGKLSATDSNPASVLSYSLVSGAGDTGNSEFRISGNQLLAARSFNFEEASGYTIRVRVSNQFSQFTEMNFTISIQDVNEPPTLDVIGDYRLFYTLNQQVLPLNNMTPGPETEQKVTATVRSDNPALFEQLLISGRQILYKIKANAIGKANIIVTVTDNGDLLNGGPKSIDRSFNLIIDPIPVISASADPISKGFTSNLQVKSAAPATYTWSPATGLSSTTIANPVAKPLTTTTYSVRVTNQFGISVDVSITITVKEDYNLFIPNVFSPNGDGQNDNWVIENLDSYSDYELTVLDRSGRVLLNKKNYQNDWNGTANGQPLEEGTYYYIIKFQDRSALKKGFITIIR